MRGDVGFHAIRIVRLSVLSFSRSYDLAFASILLSFM